MQLNWRFLILMAALFAVLFGGFGCNTTQLTLEQVEIQRKTLQSYSEFARENNLDLVIVADVDVDGRFELTQGAKYLPLSAHAQATMTSRSGWTSATPKPGLPDQAKEQALKDEKSQ